jgi:hypothetical protein
MKKRRTLIISVLLIAALALGIGYAALSRELVISSTANLAADENDFDIVFVEAKVDSTNVDGASAPYSNIATASVTGTGTTANYTIAGLSKKDESVTLKFVIENKTADVEAKLVSLSQIAGECYIGEGTTTAVTPSDYFDKTVSIVNDDTAATYTAGQEFVLEAGQTATVTITITMKQTITDKLTLTGASVMLDFASAGAVTTETAAP